MNNAFQPNRYPSLVIQILGYIVPSFVYNAGPLKMFTLNVRKERQSDDGYD